MDGAGTHLDEAARRFGAVPAGPVRSGVGDRSAGCPVEVGGVPRWLRVVAVPETRAHPLVWTGTASAAVLPDTVRRPALHAVAEWRTARLLVRAEILGLVEEPACSDTEALRAGLDLPDGWWHRLRASLDALAAVTTDRVPRTQVQLDRVLGGLFGTAVDATVTTWVTAHGDLRWTNLTRRTPYLLDWEFWGAAPAGTDAATLYCTSLLVPDVADRVRSEFADVLATHDGRLAQLCVCVQLLRHVDCGDLARPLHRLVEELVPTLAAGGRELTRSE